MTTQQKLKQLIEDLDLGIIDKYLTSWDEDFLEGNRSKIDDVDFFMTEKQTEQIDRIYEKCYG